MERLFEQVRSRRAAVAGGVAGAVMLVAIVNVVRSIQPSETIGVLLYIPIVAAALLFSVRGALVAAVAATVLYVLVRRPGPAEESLFLPITIRAISYFLFAALVAFGLSAVAGRRHRLDLGSIVDAKTGLATVTHLISIIDHEIARSVRYNRTFSIALVELPVAAANDATAYESMFGDLGDQVREAIRTTDYAGIRSDARGAQLVFVLPETPSDGAGIFTVRFGERIAEFLLRRNVAVSRNPGSWFEFPGDANDVRRIRNELARLVDLPLAIANSGVRR